MALGIVTTPGAQTQDLPVNISGDVRADALYMHKDTTSVFGRLPFNRTSSFVALNGKLLFTKQYTALGLLDFSITDNDILSQVDGKILENVEFGVNEMYADINFGNVFFLRLGKQRLKWGVGYSFKPSDPVNPPKDPTDLTRSLEGVRAIKAEFISRIISLMAFGVFNGKLDGIGSKLSTSSVKNTDLSLSLYIDDLRSQLIALNTSFVPFYDFPGWDSFQIWTEGCIYEKARYNSFQEGSLAGSVGMYAKSGQKYNFLLGAQGQLPTNTTLIAEYYHISEGLTKKDEQAIFTAFRSPDPDIFASSQPWLTELADRPSQLCQNNFFFSLVQPTFTENGNPFWDYIGLSTNCLLNLTDLSFLFLTTLTTTYIKDSSIDLRLSWAHGNKDSEYGNMAYNYSIALISRIYF